MAAADVHALEPRRLLATVTVTGTGDTIAPDGFVTLREAITSANNNADVNADVVGAGAYGTDTIHFNIPGGGVRTIQPTSQLPTITGPLTIDGYTQPGATANTLAAGNNAVLLIELSGTLATNAGDGLRVSADNSTIRGLVINGFTNPAVADNAGAGISLLSGADGNLITGNFIGTNAAGTAAAPNVRGIRMEDADNNTIGGTAPALRNLISGNTANGLDLFQANGNTVQGNYVGTNAAGTAAVANDFGVFSQSGLNNTYGGTSSGARNIFSGNLRDGLIAVTGDTVQGNYIGVDVTGNVDLGNGRQGIQNRGSGTLIGGTAAGARNVISGNGSHGILTGAEAEDVTIQGNVIGLNAAGTAAIANERGIVAGGPRLLVGGATAAARNVISGNTLQGIFVQADDTRIQGNYIGTNAAGNAAVGNGSAGVNIISASSGAIVGGAAAGEGNVISGNGADGVRTFDDGTVVRGNFIGTAASGTADLGNTGSGVRVSGGDDVAVGGTAAGAGNVIAFNGGDGVTVEADGAAVPERTSVLLNSIHSNGQLGIDLVGGTEDVDGVTANDAGDGDAGPSGLQNFPTISAILPQGLSTNFQVQFTGPANTTYSAEFFSSPTADPSGFGEGRTYLGGGSVSTNGSGAGSANVNLIVELQEGEQITATLTGPDGTSEFSAAVTAPPNDEANPLIVTNTNDTGTGSLRAAIAFANSNPNANATTPDVITFAIPGSGVKTITPIAVLPVITDPVTIDGYTQSGATANTLAVGNNATLRIELSGQSAPANTDLLQINTGNTTIRGLVINQSKRNGVSILTGANNSNNVIAGNFIGTNAAGTSALPNTSTGVQIAPSTDNRVGGTTPADRNVISGNGTAGVSVGFGVQARSERNVIQGNYIGTNAAGTAAVGNGISGVEVIGAASPRDQQNTIGGTSAGARNVISGNSSRGIGISFAGGQLVQGNYIGTNATGETAIANGAGIVLTSTSLNVIGGTVAGAGNLISGNLNDGIGVTVRGGNPIDDNRFQGNAIGVNAAGNAALGNGGDGIEIDIAGVFQSGNTVGGDSLGAGNVISGNGGNGVQFTSGSDAFIHGNFIGTDRAGTLAIPNQMNGVSLKSGVQVDVGGQQAGQGNAIAYNLLDGVSIPSDPIFVAGRILGNAIFSNGQLGIDLGDDGVTTNDPGDADDGANFRANTPVVDSAVLLSTAKARVRFDLDVVPNDTYRVEFFSSPAADPSGFGEGQTYLGFATVTIGASGTAVDQVVELNAAVPVGHVITATATGTVSGESSTSEFSNAVAVVPAVRVDDVTKQEGTGGTTPFTFTVALSASPGVTRTIDFTTTDGTAAAPGDYASRTGTLTFGPSETSKTITVSVVGDADLESDETFKLDLSNSSGGWPDAVEDAEGLGTITNDDTATPPQGATFSIDDVSQAEGTDAGSTDFAFTVTRGGNTSGTDVVDYATADGTATVAGNDYAATSGSLTFGPGETSQTITVPVTGDAVVEADETFFVNLRLPRATAGAANPPPPTIGDGEGKGTILNDDQPPTPTAPNLSINDVSMTEGNGGTKLFTFTVTRTGDTRGASSASWATQNVTAGEGDYVVASGSVSFGGGQTSRTINVAVKGDTKVEGDETFFVNLSSPVNATLADGQGQGTILNDDGTPPPMPTGSIKGHVFDDRNANARRDAGEPVLSGWTVYIDADHDGRRDSGERTATTNSSGDYTFGNVGAGRYVIRVVLKSGWRQVKPPMNDPHVVALAAGQTAIDRGFGVTRAASVAGTVFRDADRDGRLDAGEAGVAGRTLFIDQDNDGRLDAGELSTTTDGSGRYTFFAVPGGTARVRLVPAGSTPTSPSNGLRTLSLSDAQVVSGVNFGLR